MVGYLFGGNTGLTYQDLQSRREAADALAKRILGQQPKNVPEGIGALLMGAASGIGRWRADKGLREGREAASTQFDSVLGRILGGSNPSSSNSSAASSMPTTTDAGNEMAATSPSVAGGPEAYRNAIASIESAGSGDYAAVGPTHPKLGRALGRYQIMEANIGPWSQEALGRAVTPEEFMADPKLQDAIFDKKFGGYVQQYGPEGAAQAWIGGPGGVGKLGRKDSLGTSVGAYGSKFLNALGPQAAAATPASAAIDAQVPASGYVDPMVSAPNFQQPANQMTPQLQNPAQAANLPIQNPVQPGSKPLPQQQAAALPPLPSRDVAAAPPVASVPPQQMAQAAPPQMPRAQPYRPDPEMLKILSNPFLDEGQKGALRLVMQQQMQQHQAQQEQQIWQARQEYERWQKTSDPDYQLGLDYKRAQLKALDDKTTQTPESVRALNIRAQQAGLKPGTPEYNNFMLTGGKDGTNITVNTGEGDKFFENLDKKNAETFAAMSDAGMQARGRLGQIDRLESIFANVPQGAEGAFKKLAGDWGVPIGEGTSDIQAASALLEKMVPEQRLPGSGTMSDGDIKMFRASLPRIINQPGGNQLIFQTMRGIAQYEQQMGEIADAVADRAITPAEGRQRIRQLKNPLAEYKIPEGSTPNGGFKTRTGVQWSVE
ncbi:hypothetical protein PMI07_002365 [Rhizobium sp. CF080]|uniref:hypothetical protein n=1 Tax=Rhizobium sp. (strain CF080) TaxID=1144310 RepID=UPI0002716FCF|nr:hypothetical protein [Rhizobium sp. CF080]EUB95877.1 hypothetical protein PMI07_002365 [Rhizobium sp. CF080]